jgi:rhodanese-related sulfurtransferase
MLKPYAITALLLGLLFAGTASAETKVKISGKLDSVTVGTEDGPVIIQRNQDPDHMVTGDYAKTSRPCPPFCVQPMQAAPGVTTVGELELLDLHSSKQAILIDARTEDWHIKETIPGSVNIPYTLLAQRLDELGCTKNGKQWQCSDAKPVILYCNGMWCGQSPIGIRAMLREGYPADRIYYYRGGMQAWKILGFNTVEGSL